MKRQVTFVTLYSHNTPIYAEGSIQTDYVMMLKEWTLVAVDPVVRITFHNGDTVIVKGTVENWGVLCNSEM